MKRARTDAQVRLTNDYDAPWPAAALQPFFATVDGEHWPVCPRDARDAVRAYLLGVAAAERHELAEAMDRYLEQRLAVVALRAPHLLAGQRGVRARTDLPALTVLGLYGGRITTWRRHDEGGDCELDAACGGQRCDDYAWGLGLRSDIARHKDAARRDAAIRAVPEALELLNGDLEGIPAQLELEVLGGHGGNLLRLLNDPRGIARAPNVATVPVWWCGAPRIVYYTRRAIAAGTELLNDYGPEFDFGAAPPPAALRAPAQPAATTAARKRPAAAARKRPAAPARKRPAAPAGAAASPNGRVLRQVVEHRSGLRGYRFRVVWDDAPPGAAPSRDWPSLDKLVAVAPPPSGEHVYPAALRAYLGTHPASLRASVAAALDALARGRAPSPVPAPDPDAETAATTAVAPNPDAETVVIATVVFEDRVMPAPAATAFSDIQQIDTAALLDRLQAVEASLAALRRPTEPQPPPATAPVPGAWVFVPHAPQGPRTEPPLAPAARQAPPSPPPAAAPAFPWALAVGSPPLLLAAPARLSRSERGAAPALPQRLGTASLVRKTDAVVRDRTPTRTSDSDSDSA